MRYCEMVPDAAQNWGKHGTLKELPVGTHALSTICVDDVNQELLKFLQS
jgi:hypothetical protein